MLHATSVETSIKVLHLMEHKFVPDIIYDLLS